MTAQHFSISEEKMVSISDADVDIDALQPLPEHDGSITHGFAGRLLTDKGIRALLAAHDILRAQGLQTKLLIAGNPGPANPASVSLKEVNEWAQRPGVSWLGHVQDISSLWKQSHFAVLPSHREGLPGASAGAP